MNTAYASIMALSFAFAGMAALSLAIGRHYSQVTGRHDVPPWRRLALRSSGWLLIMVSLGSCVAGWGVSVGLVAWFGFLTAGALMAALLLTYAPRSMAVAAILLCGIAMLALLAR